VPSNAATRQPTVDDATTVMSRNARAVLETTEMDLAWVSAYAAMASARPFRVGLGREEGGGRVWGDAPATSPAVDRTVSSELDKEPAPEAQAGATQISGGGGSNAEAAALSQDKQQRQRQRVGTTQCNMWPRKSMQRKLVSTYPGGVGEGAQRCPISHARRLRASNVAGTGTRRAS